MSITGKIVANITGQICVDITDAPQGGPVYGPDIAEDADNNQLWLLQNGASFVGGKLQFAGTGWALAQRAQPFETGKTYRVDVSINSASGGNLRFGVRNAANTGFLEESADVGAGDHYLLVTPDGDDVFLRFWAVSQTTVAEIETFTIREVL